MKKEEVWSDVEATLDQLIANAEALKDALVNPLLEEEALALQKTQESLLFRLVHRHDMLKEEPKGFQKAARSRKAVSKSRG